MRIPGQPKISAGLMMYRVVGGELEVLLAHPGGPFFLRKNQAHWTIPKGQPNRGEELIEAAQREFFEEVGYKPSGPFIELGSIQQKGGKIVYGWGCEGDLPEGFQHTCNTFSAEWPPRSGKFCEFPEIDRVNFFKVDEAREHLKEAQIPLLDRLIAHLEATR